MHTVNRIKMKKIFQTLVMMALMLPLLLNSCKKQELKIYEDTDPGIRLGTFTYNYSFIQDLEAETKTIYIPVHLSGMMRDYDRKLLMEIVDDSTTTAEPEWIEIQEGILPKNSIKGEIPIVLKRTAYLDTASATIKLRILPSDGLSIRGWSQVDIKWTSKIIQPQNWMSFLRFYFGIPFSTAYFKFIVDVTGQTNFDSGPIQAYSLQVKDELIKYNKQLKKDTGNPDTVLVHDDGIYKGSAVTLP